MYVLTGKFLWTDHFLASVYGSGQSGRPLCSMLFGTMSSTFVFWQGLTSLLLPVPKLSLLQWRPAVPLWLRHYGQRRDAASCLGLVPGKWAWGRILPCAHHSFSRLWHAWGLFCQLLGDFLITVQKRLLAATCLSISFIRRNISFSKDLILWE